jgi:hypoxanthine-guanine phosphoribosyltransferase
MDHTILFSPGDIKREVSRLAEAIDATGADSLLVVAVLKGAAIFSSDLVWCVLGLLEARSIGFQSTVLLVVGHGRCPRIRSVERR